MEMYYLQAGIIQALTITQLVILLRKLWSFECLEKSQKTEWTVLLILFNMVTSLIFIWKKMDEFEKKNLDRQNEQS